MAKKNAWSSVKFGSYTVKYSKGNKTWQVWREKAILLPITPKKVRQ